MRGRGGFYIAGQLDVKLLADAGFNVHKKETSPLHPNLSYTQQPSRTSRWTNNLTAIHILPTCRQNQDICYRACSGCSAEENVVWREAF